MALVASVLGSTPFLAQAPPELKRKPNAMGVGVGVVRFDTNFKFTEKATGGSIFVDAEGTLGLPESDVVGMLYGTFRLAKRHSIGFSAFNVRRTETLLDGTTSLGDYTLTGEATLADRSGFYHVAYRYVFLEDERSRVQGAFGIYGADLEYSFDFMGQISYLGVPQPTDTLEREASVFAPLPMFGFDATFALTSKWWLGVRLDLVGGSFGDVSGGILDTAIRSGYEFSKHTGVVLGLEYFSADLTIDDGDFETEVDYRFDGLYLGLHFSF
jgi:hypothetical protein